jgi:ribosomal protein L37E
MANASATIWKTCKFTDGVEAALLAWFEFASFCPRKASAELLSFVPQLTAIARSIRCGQNSAAARHNPCSTCPSLFPRLSTFRDPQPSFVTRFTIISASISRQFTPRKGASLPVCSDCRVSCAAAIFFALRNLIEK